MPPPSLGFWSTKLKSLVGIGLILWLLEQLILYSKLKVLIIHSLGLCLSLTSCLFSFIFSFLFHRMSPDSRSPKEMPKCHTYHGGQNNLKSWRSLLRDKIGYTLKNYFEYKKQKRERNNKGKRLWSGLGESVPKLLSPWIIRDLFLGSLRATAFILSFQYMFFHFLTSSCAKYNWPHLASCQTLQRSFQENKMSILVSEKFLYSKVVRRRISVGRTQAGDVLLISKAGKKPVFLLLNVHVLNWANVVLVFHSKKERSQRPFKTISFAFRYSGD